MCIGFLLYTIFALVQLAKMVLGSLWLNRRMGRPNTFFNLSLHSCLQLTSWVCAQLLSIHGTKAEPHLQKIWAAGGLTEGEAGFLWVSFQNIHYFNDLPCCLSALLQQKATALCISCTNQSCWNCAGRIIDNRFWVMYTV